MANRISCAYEEREKAPFSVTLFEPFFGEFVTENVMGAFSLSELAQLIRLDTAFPRTRSPHPARIRGFRPRVSPLCVRPLPSSRGNPPPRPKQAEKEENPQKRADQAGKLEGGLVGDGDGVEAFGQGEAQEGFVHLFVGLRLSVYGDGIAPVVGKGGGQVAAGGQIDGSLEDGRRAGGDG